MKKYKDYALDMNINSFGNSSLVNRCHITADLIMQMYFELQEVAKDSKILQNPSLKEYMQAQQAGLAAEKAAQTKLEKEREKAKQEFLRRQQAMNKLTPEEIKAFKLTEKKEKPAGWSRRLYRSKI